MVCTDRKYHCTVPYLDYSLHFLSQFVLHIWLPQLKPGRLLCRQQCFVTYILTTTFQFHYMSIWTGCSMWLLKIQTYTRSPRRIVPQYNIKILSYLCMELLTLLHWLFLRSLCHSWAACRSPWSRCHQHQSYRLVTKRLLCCNCEIWPTLGTYQRHSVG